jgi:hypothetical protein
MRRSDLGYEAEGKDGSGHKQTLKGLNPVMFKVGEVDLFPIQGKQHSCIRLVRDARTLPGSQTIA